MPANDQRPVRKPKEPFYFNTSEHLLRIGRQKAMYNQQNRDRMSFDEQMVVIHDPQPLPLVQASRTLGMAMPHRPLQSKRTRVGILATVRRTI